MAIRSTIRGVAVAAAALAPGRASAQPATPPMNVVILYADDLGARDLGCTGSTFYATPNCDRLAREGVNFSRAYASCPVCSPSRAALFTGCNPIDTDVTNFIGDNLPGQWTRNTRLLPAPYAQRLDPALTTFATRLEAAGYATQFNGKWHLGGGPTSSPGARGFGDVVGGTPAGSTSVRLAPFKEPGYAWARPGQYLSDAQAEATARFIDANKDRPFCAVVSFYDVHIPLIGPPDLQEKYAAKAASVTDAPLREVDGVGVRMTQSNAVYGSMVEGMDAAVGKVLDAIDRAGVRDRTLVIFSSDNGGLSTAEGRPTSNAPLRTGKGWLYEGGIRVPLIVRWPGVQASAGATSDAITITTDLAATILDAAGLPPEGGPTEGRSLRPAIVGDAWPARTLGWHYPHYGNQGGFPGGVYREGNWKLIVRYENDARELYDIANDPNEEHDLAAERPDVARRLYDAFVAWRAGHRGKMPTTNPKFDPTKPAGIGKAIRE